MKKKFLFLFTCFSISFSLFAQNITDEGNEWKIATFGFGGTSTSTRTISGDTLVNNIIYKKIISTNNYNDQSYLTHLARQDSSQKVFILENEEEHMVYDFQAALGDTVLYLGNSFPDPSFATVEAIDSVILLDGTSRKRQRLISVECPNNAEEFWIEGIGGEHYSFTGLSLLCGADGGAAINCFSSNNQLLYGPRFDSTCDILLVTNDLENSTFEISPNPAQHRFFVKSKNANEANFNLQLFNFQGIQVLEQQTFISKNEKIEIRTQHLSSGIYFLKIENNNTSTVQKIIISN